MIERSLVKKLNQKSVCFQLESFQSASGCLRAFHFGLILKMAQFKFSKGL